MFQIFEKVIEKIVSNPIENMQDGTSFGTTMNQSQNIARQGPIIQRTPAPRKPVVKQAEQRVITPVTILIKLLL